MKENGSIEIKNGEIGMEIDKDMILGGIVCATTYIMLAILIVELITTGGLKCIV